MHYRFFTIRALDPAEGAEQLNAFLAANSVLSVETVGCGEVRTASIEKTPLTL